MTDFFNGLHTSTNQIKKIIFYKWWVCLMVFLLATLPIMIYISSLFNFGVTAGGSADINSNGIIEICCPNNPKIDTICHTKILR